MAKVLITEDYLSDIGDAIRGKLGGSTQYTPGQMASAISRIPTVNPTLVSKSIVANGTYDAEDDDADGYDSVSVNVPNSYSASDEGKVVSNGNLLVQTTKQITANGTHDTTTNNSVAVDVPNSYTTSDNGKVVVNQALVAQTSKNINANGTHDTTANNSVVVDVPNSYAAADEGKVVDGGELVAQTSTTKTTNGTYDTTLNNEVVVAVPAPVLVQKTITENGIYLPSSDNADGYSGISVNVSGGGGGDGDVVLLTRSEWDALSTAEKQACGLVAIQETATGFERGVLVNGADYLPLGIYIPSSDSAKIICEAYPKLFDSSKNSWGGGYNPIVLDNNPSLQSDDSVKLIGNNSKASGYVDLGAISTPFTAYIVAKTTSGTNYRRILSCVNARSAGKGIMLYGQTITVSQWASDTSTGISSASDYFVGVIQFISAGNALGAAINANSQTPSFISKSPSTCGRYLTIGRTDIDANTSNAEACDINVKYLAVVSEAESQSVIAQNMANLLNEFILNA